VEVDLGSCVLYTKAVERLPLRQLGFLVYSGLRNLFFSARVRFWPFKVIQGHWFWYHRKCILDIAGFWCSWPHPYSTLILEVFPSDQIAYVGVSVSRYLRLFNREIIFEVFQPVWKSYLNVTDGQTDRRLTVASPRSAVKMKGKTKIKERDRLKYISTPCFIKKTPP